RTNEKNASFYFLIGIGIAALAIATSITASTMEWPEDGIKPANAAFGLLTAGLLILYYAYLNYLQQFNKRLVYSALITTILGSLAVILPNQFDISIPFLTLSGLFLFFIGVYLMLFSLGKPKRKQRYKAVKR
ncbi:MAG: hypothetical protein GWN64_12990, partial [Candidatus Thorarchaeota archaeon]|nr:hypothetical protein [Candidatus Thorarchaeota archaeon]